MSINIKFCEHAYSHRATYHSFLSKLDELSDSGINRDGLSAVVRCAVEFNLCTQAEIKKSFGWKRAIHGTTIDDVDEISPVITMRPSQVLDFLKRRTTKAVNVTKNPRGYIPSSKDVIPKGFMGWRGFVAK